MTFSWDCSCFCLYKLNVREKTKTENMGEKEREKRNWHSICLRIRLLHPRHDGGGEEVLADILLFEMMTIRKVANSTSHRCDDHPANSHCISITSESEHACSPLTWDGHVGGPRRGNEASFSPVGKRCPVPKHLESFESRSEEEAFRNFEVSAFRLNAYP